jgi:hypothetical protein
LKWFYWCYIKNQEQHLLGVYCMYMYSAEMINMSSEFHFWSSKSNETSLWRGAICWIYKYAQITDIFCSAIYWVIGLALISGDPLEIITSVNKLLHYVELWIWFSLYFCSWKENRIHCQTLSCTVSILIFFFRNTSSFPQNWVCNWISLTWIKQIAVLKLGI